MVETSAGTWIVLCADPDDVSRTIASSTGADHGDALPFRNGPEKAFASRTTSIRSRNTIVIFALGTPHRCGSTKPKLGSQVMAEFDQAADFVYKILLGAPDRVAPVKAQQSRAEVGGQKPGTWRWQRFVAMKKITRGMRLLSNEISASEAWERIGCQTHD